MLFSCGIIEDAAAHRWDDMSRTHTHSHTHSGVAMQVVSA